MSRPWMPLYIADYLKKTTRLGALESGAYLHLIMDYWQNGNLPSDDRALARIAKMTDKEWKAARTTLAAFFGPKWTHARIDEELKKAAELSDKRRAAAEQRHGKKDAIAPAIAPPNDHAKELAIAPTVHLAPSKIDGGGDASARGLSLISNEAGSIASEIAVFCGLPEDPTIRPMNWYGAPLTVQSWLNDGCKREIIIPACREAIARKSDGPPDTINYFTKAVARAHARFRAPMPVVTLSEPEQISGNRRNWQSNPIKDAFAELRNELAGEVGGVEGDPPMLDITPASARRG